MWEIDDSFHRIWAEFVTNGAQTRSHKWVTVVLKIPTKRPRLVGLHQLVTLIEDGDSQSDWLFESGGKFIGETKKL